MGDFAMDDYAEFRHFKYLLALAETGGMRAAALALNTAQPSLGRQIREFQEHYGVRFYRRRKGRGIELTPAGEALKVIAKDILELREEALAALMATGKSVHGNNLIALEQKYGGFTYIFDIGGSYESVVELYGGRVDRVGKDGPRVNPFSLEPTESNIKFLYSFVKLLLANGGAELEPEDDDVIYKAVQDMYLLDAPNRRLSNLYLPKKLDRYMSKWVGKGIYNAVFDNVEDSLSLSRLQCFDFQGVNNEQYADLIEPLMVWLLRRINDVLYNPANLGVPKHILIEEIFSSMKNKQLLDGALASIKTVRKNLGGVTMIGQSADDLGANADSIVNSCTSFLFLKDATFNRKRYAELFKMNEQQLALFESLQDREGLYTFQLQEISSDADAHFDSKVFIVPGDKAAKDRLQAAQNVPGPEAAGAPPMTAAQRSAMYGDSPNAPNKTSNVSQVQAEAKQKALEKEKVHQDAVNSDTVAIDFAHPAASAAPAASPAAQTTAVLGEREEMTPKASSETLAASTPEAGEARRLAGLQTASEKQPKVAGKGSPMAPYDFDSYQGQLYGIAHVARTANLSDVVAAVSFYGDLPDRIRDAVTNFKMLPERMDPTCSECN